MKLKPILFSTLIAAAGVAGAQDSTSMHVSDADGVYATTTVTAELQLVEYTLETWVYVPSSVPAATGMSTDEKFFIETYTGGGAGGYALRIGVSGAIRSWTMGSAGVIPCDGATTVPHGEWVHIAATYDETEDSMKVFLNGVQDGSNFVAQDALAYSATILKIGARGDDTDQNHNYMLDEVRIWNFAKTEAEIAEDMNNCLVGDEDGLVLYYSFEDTDASTVYDGTSFGHDATIAGFSATALDDGVFDCCMIDNTVSLDGVTLSANQNDADYQWIDCSDDSEIAGATSQDFTPTADGDYAVIIDDGICIDTSACTTVAGVGVGENEFKAISVYPNPATNVLNVDGEYDLAIIKTMTGQTLTSIVEGESADISDFAVGTYVIEIKAKDQVIRKMFIKR